MFAIEYCRGGGNWHSLINFYCDFSQYLSGCHKVPFRVSWLLFDAGKNFTSFEKFWRVVFLMKKKKNILPVLHA